MLEMNDTTVLCIFICVVFMLNMIMTEVNTDKLQNKIDKLKSKIKELEERLDVRNNENNR